MLASRNGGPLSSNFPKSGTTRIELLIRRAKSPVLVNVGFRGLELTRFRGVCLAGKARRRAMPKTHPPYPAEYRRRMVEQVRAGRSLKELAREFEPSVESIRQWVRQAQLDIGERSDGLTSSEREELTRLRRENRVLREEREILSKAAAWFATETGSVPSRRSNS
jgi:transposase